MLVRLIVHPHSITASMERWRGSGSWWCNAQFLRKDVSSHTRGTIFESIWCDNEQIQLINRSTLDRFPNWITKLWIIILIYCVSLCIEHILREIKVTFVSIYNCQHCFNPFYSHVTDKIPYAHCRFHSRACTSRYVVYVFNSPLVCMRYTRLKATTTAHTHDSWLFEMIGNQFGMQ